MTEPVIYTTDSQYASDTAQGIVLVDYYAEWCGPCKSLAPKLAQAAVHFEGKISVVKVDIDECPKATQKADVRVVPTLHLQQNGRKLASHSGDLSYEQLCQFINKAL